MHKFGMDGAIQASEAGPESTKNFGQALRDALRIAMRRSPEVLIFGEGITDSGAIFGSTSGLLEEFGAERVIETPLSEAAITGICVGAGLAGMKPVLVHQRIDFSLLGADQLINHAAKWRYMYDGKLQVPFVLRCIVGKSWGQAAQHSQSLQALYAHIPGLKVVMPANAHDAKGLLLASIYDGNPIVFIEPRPLYNQSMSVPEGFYQEAIGKAAIRRVGSKLTVIGVSYLMPDILAAAAECAPGAIEVIDLRSISPLDKNALVQSVRKTGMALVADTSWKSFGISAEISALLHEECFAYLRAPVERIALPDVPTPCSPVLEKAFYPTRDAMAAKMAAMLRAAPARHFRDESAAKPPHSPLLG